MIPRLALLLGLAFGVGGCGAGDEGEIPALTDGRTRLSSAKGVTLEVVAAEPLRTGANVFDVHLTNAAGTKLVSATGLMPSHGHGTRPAEVLASGDDYVVRDLVLYMAGRWEVRLGLSNDDEALFLVDVP